MLPVRVCGDRLLIRADVETHAPTTHASGVVTATTLAAATTGMDPQRSWFVGTVVAVGPDVHAFNIRPFVLRRLSELIESFYAEGHRKALDALRQEIAELPRETAETFLIGERVVFSWASGQDLALNEDRYVILHAPEILAVLTGAPPSAIVEW